MKRYITILLLSLIHISLWADEQERHEFTMGGSLGFTAMKLTLNSLTPTGGISVGYNFFLSDVVGVGTGLGWSLYQWKTVMETFSDRYPAHDGQEAFEFRSSFSDYTETQNASFFTIPFVVRLQYPLFSDDNLTYFSIGGKAGIPLRSKYRTSDATFTTSAYYPAYDVLLESPRSHGLGTFTTEGQVSNLHLKTMWMLTAEAGMKWDISHQFSLYTGICIDYSLNSINREKGMSFLVYDSNNPTQMNFNSMLNSKYTQADKTKSFVNRVNPIAASIVLRIAFKLPE